jgi:hypothetical protein
VLSSGGSCSCGADAVFDGLSEKYGEAMARDDVKAIVLTGEISQSLTVYLLAP